VFDRGDAGGGEEEFERERDPLKAIIGHQTVKLEFMEKTDRPVKKERAERLERSPPKLSVRTQCEMLREPRSSIDERPVGESKEAWARARLRDGIYWAEAFGSENSRSTPALLAGL
jgi:hypothetical protein